MCMCTCLYGYIDNIGYLLIKPSLHTQQGGLETQLEVRPFILRKKVLEGGKWPAWARSWLAGPGLECLHSSHWEVMVGWIWSWLAGYAGLRGTGSFLPVWLATLPKGGRKQERLVYNLVWLNLNLNLLSEECR